MDEAKVNDRVVKDPVVIDADFDDDWPEDWITRRDGRYVYLEG